MSDPADLGTTTRPTQSAPLPAGCPRRTLLKAAGLAALVGAGGVGLVACGANDSASPGTSAGPESSSTPSAEASATSPSTAASSAATSEAAPSGPSLAKADVPKGSGVIMDSADYVVTQPTAGDYKAFSAKCTHMQFKVGEVNGKVIKCLHHGSEFSITDGSVINGPAAAPLPEAKVTASGSELVISG